MMEMNIGELYKKYGPMVLRRCRLLLGDEEKAMDAMQDVFVKLITSSGNIELEYPSSFLYRVATNTCLNIIRNEKKHPETAGEKILELIAAHEDHAESFETREMLDSVFMNEKPTTKEIAVMLFVDRMTLEQAARSSGLSVSGVRKRMRVLKEKALLLKEEIYEN